MHGDVAFVEIGHELRTHSRRAEARQQDKRHGDADHQAPGLQREVQRRLIADPGPAHHEAVLFLHLAGDEHRDRGRHKGQRQDEGGGQGDDDGDRHRVEHLSFNPGQAENRHIDEGDDQNPEQRRPDDLAGSRGRQIKSLVPGQDTAQTVLGLPEAAQAVLHDDDGAVDDQAEVERAEAHQIPRSARPHHAGDGHQHGDRDDRRRDQGGADVSEQQEQHDDDQQGAFQQVFLNCVDGAIDQVRPVIDRRCGHPVG